MKVETFVAPTHIPAQPVYLEAGFRSIVSLCNGEIYPIERRAAEEMLALFRRALLPYNTRRHTIAISDRDGIGVVLVNGSAHWLWRRSFRHRTPVINMLLRIQALLQVRFMQYVRNERIN